MIGLSQATRSNRAILISIFLVLIATCLLYLMKARLTAATEAPRLEMSTTVIDLGSGKPGDTLEGSLVLRNSGASSLDFEIIGSCACTVLSPNAGTIPSQSEQKIQLGVRLQSYTDAPQKIRLTVSTNDPKNNQVDCSITAACPPPIKVTPGRVDFGQVLRDTVPPALPIALESKAPEQVAVNVSGEAFRWQRNGQNQITITLRESLPPGVYQGSVDVSTADHTQEHIQIPLRAEIVDAISVVPNFAQLRRNSDGTWADIQLVICCHSDAPPGGIELLNAPPAIKLVRINASNTKRQVFKLSIEKSWAPHEAAVLTLTDPGTGRACTLELLPAPSNRR